MNVSKLITYVVTLSCLIVSTCTQPIFYWGNYSHTLYQMKKNPDIKFREAHKKELLSIINKSHKMKKTVPPGVYCEYGFLMYQDGNTEDAIKYIDLEETTYPESQTFTQRLKKMITGQNSANNGSKPAEDATDTDTDTEDNTTAE